MSERTEPTLEDRIERLVEAHPELLSFLIDLVQVIEEQEVDEEDLRAALRLYSRSPSLLYILVAMLDLTQQLQRPRELTAGEADPKPEPDPVDQG